MTQEVARAGIDFLVRESGSHHNVEVDFFGGEPLMNWDVVVDTMAYARSTYPSKKWRFTLTTNGSLLRDDMFPVLEANDVSVVLSLDGGRKANDANRVLKDGRGTFDTIIERIRHFTRTRDERWLLRPGDIRTQHAGICGECPRSPWPGIQVHLDGACRAFGGFGSCSPGKRSAGNSCSV